MVATGAFSMRMRHWMVGMMIFMVPWAFGAQKLAEVTQSAQATFSHHLPKVTMWKTRTGVPVWWVDRPQIPMLDVAVSFDAGSARDGAQFGLASMTQGLLDQGVRGLSARAVRRRLAAVGAQLTGELGRDQSIIFLRTRIQPQALESAWRILTAVVSRPTFPAHRLKLKRSERLALLVNQDEQPVSIAQKAFFKQLYSGHPYGHSTLGTQASIQRLQRKQLVRFFKRYYVRENAVIVMVGAVTRAQAEMLAERIATVLRSGKPASKMPVPHRVLQVQHVNIPFASHQTTVLLGQLAVDQHDPNLPTLMLGNHVFGGGMDSILFNTVRSQHGWAYSVNSQMFPLQKSGPFLVMLQTQHDMPSKVIDVIQVELSKFVRKGPSFEQLQRARIQFLGQLYRSLSTNRGLLRWVLDQAFYHHSINYLEEYVEKIRAVDVQSTQKVFAKHIDLPQRLWVMVGSKQR
jgi:zinc protease